MQELINSVENSIPIGLAKIANGRDNLPTNDAAYAINTAPQTIRKHLCLFGHFHGIKPIRIGGRLFFRVSELAQLVQGEPS